MESTHYKTDLSANINMDEPRAETDKSYEDVKSSQTIFSAITSGNPEGLSILMDSSYGNLSPEFIRKKIRRQLISQPQLTLSDESIDKILKKLPEHLRHKRATFCCTLLDELKNEFVESSADILLRVTMYTEIDSIESEHTSDQIAQVYRSYSETKFVRKKKAALDGKILYYFPFIRHLIVEAQKLLPVVFIDCSKYSEFKGFYHPEILISMMEKEIDREDLRMEFDWFGKLFMHVSDKEFFLGWKENKVSRFINLIIQITKTIALDRIYDTLKELLTFFTDTKTTPKIAVQVYHSFDGNIVIIPTAQDVCQVYCSLIKRVYDMGKNFEHFEMFHLKQGRRGYIYLEKYDNIRHNYEEKIKEFVVSIYQQLTDHYGTLSEKYSELMDDSCTSQEKLSAMGMEELIKMADYYIAIKCSINEIELNTYFPHFKASNKALIKALLFITECRLNQIINEVLKFHVEYCERNCEEFFNIAQKAVKVPETTEELISLAKFMNLVSTDQMNTMRENILKYLELFYRVMEIVTVPQTYFEMMGNVLGWVTHMESVIKQNSAMLLSTKHEFEERLNTVTEKLNEDLENFSTDELDGLDHLDDYNNIKSYTLHIMKCLRKVQYFDETAKWINNEETLFEMTLSTYPELDEIKAFVNPFAKLIFQLYKWNMVYMSIMDGSLECLTVNSVEETLDEYTKLISELQKWFKSKIRQQANENNPRRFKGLVDDSEYDNWPAPLKLLHGAQLNLNEIKEQKAFIALLCNPRMTEKHWEQISKIAGRDMTPYKGSSLRKFIDFKVQGKMEEFEAISESAVKEYQLKESLLQMKAEWQNVNFILGLSMTSVTILDSVDHVQSLIDDHLVKSLSIRSSAFVKPIEDDLRTWYKKLSLINTVIEEWCKVQKQWLYFMPIFSSSAIANQMKTEGQLFVEIDQCYKTLLDKVKEDSLVMSIIKEGNVLPLLECCLQKFEDIKYGVIKYLEKKRLYFSRFFFLSDEDMLQFLSETKDPKQSELFLKKCFTGISKLGFDELLNIKSIISSQGEEIRLVNKISTNEAEGSIEKWLAQVEDQMVNTIRYTMKKSLHDYSTKGLRMWIKEWPGQSVICISKLHWTCKVEKLLNNQQGKGMDGLHNKSIATINQTLSSLKNVQLNYKRTILVTLVILDVHSTDVISNLIKNKVNSSTDFLWISQLRYYWVNDLNVRILNASVKYSYEYLGNSPRLIVTPLTERCYRTLIGAYNLQYSAALEGPTSTGKTETIKDLAQALAIYCHLFNCSTGMEYITVEKFLKAIASSGAWICLHEFDRIQADVSSVIAQQMLSISQAIKQKLATFMFAGTTITLNPTCFICITLNPGYIGRFELPSSLKVLFRSMAMMVPDYLLISEVILFANGFKNSRILASKLNTAFKLCSELLPSHLHYDQGFRSYTCVLSSSIQMKTQSSILEEEAAIVTAFINVSKPKLSEMYIPLFNGIIRDVFPGTTLETKHSSKLNETVKKICLEKNLQPVENFLMKICQTNELLSIHHSIMLVGKPFSGKSSVLQILHETKNFLKEKYNIGMLTEISIINPKALSHEQLYGYFNPYTHEWIDGIVGQTFRPLTKMFHKMFWVVFDGPVSPYWIENINTALDDKKIICLNTAEIIEITSQTSIFMECEDLIEASPATISRCRMIYFEPSSLGWKALIKSWNNTLPAEWTEDDPNRFIKLFDWLIPNCSEFIITNFNSHCDVGIESNVRSICDFTKIMLHEATLGQDTKNINSWAQAAVILAIVWCFGGKLERNSREAFDIFFRSLWQFEENDTNTKTSPPMELEIMLPNDGLIEDNSYIFKSKGNWKYWPEVLRTMKLDDIYDPHTNMVSTLETLKYGAIVELFTKYKKSFMFMGSSGTGKTAFLRTLLVNEFSNDYFIPSFISCNASSTAYSTQEIILTKLIKKKKGIYGPSGNRTSIIFIDDLNMQENKTNGHHCSLELLRQFFDYGYWYGLRNTEKIFLQDIFFICAMGIQNGSGPNLPLRFLRHFSIFKCNSFTDESLTKIFSTIVFWGLRKNGFPTDIMSLTQQVILATVYIYNSINKNLLPTPVKCHYSFSIRDLMRVFHGFLLMRKESMDGKKAFIRMWVHEILRVFYDRLVEQSDKDWLFDELKHTVDEVYKEEFDLMLDGLDENNIEVNQTTLSNLMFTTAFNSDASENNKYEEIPSIELFFNLTLKVLEEYKLIHKSASNIILFKYALEHISRIHRILSVPNGNGVLIGFNGTGKQSLVKLSAFMLHQKLFQPDVKKDYKCADWKSELKNILKESGTQNESCVLLLNETQLKIDYIIQNIDSILNTGEVPNLYAINEVQDITEIVRIAAESECVNSDVNPLAVFEYFINQCKRNLHIMLCFSPIGSDFRTTIRMFPSIVNCCTIDWFESEWTLIVHGHQLQTTYMPLVYRFSRDYSSFHCNCCDLSKGWPEDALECVAREYLMLIDLEEDMKLQIIDICKYFHASARNSSKEFYNMMGRKTYVTSTSFTDLLTLYKIWVKKKRDELRQSKERYLGGLDKLEFAASQVEIMQKDLESLQPALKKAAEETSKMLKVIETETFEVEKASERVRLDEEIANEQAVSAMELKTECENDLAQAIPILEDAVAALNTLKPADITLVKSMKNPPETVKLVLAAVCVMKGIKADRLPDPKNPGRRINDYWGPSKRLLGDMSFLQQLKDYDKDNIPASIMKAVRSQYLNHKDFKPKVVAKASSAAEGLCKWVIALDKYDVVVKEVAPKKEKLRIAEKEYSETMAILEEKRNLLKGLEDKLAELKENLKEANERKIRLQNEVVLCSNKLQKAQRIIGSLGGEKERWVQVANELKKQFCEIPGNILISCSIIAYLSPFTPEFRKTIVRDWCKLCTEMEIPISSEYSLAHALGSSVLVEQWRIFGLSSDSFSVENAVILNSSEKWSLLIDPQNQANKWIRNLEGSNGLCIIRHTTNYVDAVKNCLMKGKPLLLEDIQEELDSFFDSILRKYTFVRDNKIYTNIGGTEIEYHKDFRFYMTTKLSNPHFLPEIYKYITVINFTLTEEGLADQLLEIVVAKERPELQEKRQTLIRESTKNKQDLQDVEDKILRTLSSVVGNILEDENAVNSLDLSKTKAEDIKQKEAAEKDTRDDIEYFRKDYKSVGEHCAALYSTILNLSVLNPMYQFSLDWFIKIFLKSIDSASKSNITEERTEGLKKTFNHSLYINVSYTLFDKDKILYSFILCKMLLLKENKIDSSEIDLLIDEQDIHKGDTGINPAKDWLPEKIWRNICRLNSHATYQSIIEDFSANIDAWEKFYSMDYPNWDDIPLLRRNKLTSFQKLIILNGIRPDRFISGMRSFIQNELGDEFVFPPPLNFDKAFEESDHKTPLILIQSPGNDFMQTLLTYVKEKNKSNKFKCISAGAGEVSVLLKTISDAQIQGTWICYQNCHLALPYMNVLENSLDNNDFEYPSPEFRLWLTTNPSAQFPVALLQRGVKMTIQTPKILKENLYQRFTTEPVNNLSFFESCPGKEQVFTTLLYCISFFHAVICERTKFGYLGWNMPYNFDESDFLISVLQLQTFVSEYVETPRTALEYLLAECNYGGKVSDQWDLRMLKTILHEFLNEDIISNKKYQLIESNDSYSLPVRNDYKDFLDCIQKLPLFSTPDVHGLHRNADISTNLEQSAYIIYGLASITGRQKKGDTIFGQRILIVVEEILVKMPLEFNKDDIQLQYPYEYDQCMNSVLVQEVIRLNCLNKTITETLKCILKALRGFSVLSPELECISNELVTGKIPNEWLKVSYPSLKSLGAYISDFIQRVDFIQDWCNCGTLKNYWISGISCLQAFLTSVILNYSRKWKIPFDSLTFDFEVLCTDRSGEYAEFGIFVYGLFLKGARWNRSEMCLDNEIPMVFTDPLPAIWIKPCKKDNLKYKKRYNCPVYVTKFGALTTPDYSNNYIFRVLLETKLPNAFWIKRGTAMFCQIND